MITVSSVPIAPLTLRRLWYPFAQTLRDYRNPTRARCREIREGMLLNWLPQCHAHSATGWRRAWDCLTDLARSLRWLLREMSRFGCLECSGTWSSRAPIISSSPTTCHRTARLTSWPSWRGTCRSPCWTTKSPAATRPGRSAGLPMPRVDGAEVLRVVVPTSIRRRRSITYRHWTCQMPQILSSRSCGAEPSRAPTRSPSETPFSLRFTRAITG